MSKMCEDIACIKSEIDLFSPQPRQVGMTESTWIDYHPISALTHGAPIEFFITGPSDGYLDLSQTMLIIRGKVTKADGGNLDPDNTDANKKDIVAPCNLFLHSMFQDVSLTFNEKQIEGSSHMYPYRSFLSTLMLFDNNAKKAQLSSQGWAKDDSRKMDDVLGNGFLDRAPIIAKSREFELAGPLNLDFFQQSKDLLNLVNVRIKLTPASADFALMSKRDDDYKINISSAILNIRKVGIKSSLLMDNETHLKREPAIYHQQRSHMLTYTITNGSLSHTRDNLFLGLMPKFVLVGMVRNDAYNGKITKNPFNFQDFSVNQMGMYREVTCITGQPLKFNFTEKLCVREYQRFYQNLEQYNINESMGITFEDFLKGTTLFAFNFTPDLEMAGHTQEDQAGNVRLDIQFTEALPSSINVIVMSLYDGKISFDQHRNVATDFNV